MKRSIILIALLALAAAPALADWPVNGIRVSDMQAYDQWNCSMVPDGSEGIIYIWQDGDNSIWAQRYDHLGNKKWMMDVRVDPDSGNVGAVTACRDGAGGAVVAWVESGAVQRVRLQRISSNGFLLWPDRGVPVTVTPGLGQREPVLMPGPTSFQPMVAFGQYTAAAVWKTYIQKLDLNGNRLWGADGMAACGYDASQQTVFGLASSDTSAIVGWVDTRSGGHDIYATMVYPSGPVFTDGLAVCDAAGNQSNPCIATDDSGGAFIAWQDGRNGNIDIYAQRYQVHSILAWQLNGMPVSVFSGDQEKPDICRAANGTAVVTWQDGRTAIDYGIYVQRLDKRGYRLWNAGPDSNGIVVSDTAGAQVVPRIIPNGLNDGFAVAWLDYRNGNNDIYARVVGISGAIGAQMLICTDVNDQGDPRLMRSGGQYLYYSWKDYRHGGNSSLYIQRSKWGSYVGSVLAPQLALPEDMAVLGTVNDTLRWRASPPPGATLSYRVQMDNDGSFTSPFYNQVFSDTFAVPPLATGNTYYWRVKTYYPSEGNDSSNWSGVWSFSIDTSVPSAPALYGPPDNWFAGNTWIDFSWEDVAAAYYHIQVSETSSFSAPLVDDSLGSMFSYGYDFTAPGNGDYYWRVRAGSAAHSWSPWTAIRRFVVDTAPPSCLGHIPVHNASNVPRDAKIYYMFNEPVRTDTSLHFSCSPDPGAWNVLQKGDTLEFSHGNLFNWITHYTFGSVACRDSAGNQVVASGFEFNTVNMTDTIPPRLTVLANSQPMDLGSNFVYEVYAKDQHKLNRVHLTYGPAGSGITTGDVDMAPVAGSDSLWRYVIPANHITARGLQYQVWAQDSILAGGLSNVTNYPSNPSDWYVHAVQFAGGAYSFSPGFDQWQMLSVPGDYTGVSMFDMLVDDLGAYDVSKWRLFSYQNSTLVEQGAGGSGVINRGQALWLRQRVSGAVNLDFQSVHQSFGDRLRSSPAAIPLVPGWSDVGNPLAFPVGWDTILAISDTASIAGPYRFNGSAWEYPNQVAYGGSCEPYAGYSFRNNRATNGMMRVPLIAAYKEGNKGPLWPEGWQARLTIRSGQCYDDAFFGIGAGTAAGADRWDFPEPPAGLTDASGHFLIGNGKYATDLRPELGAGQVWDYAVECGTGEVLMDCGLPSLPGVRLHLADLARQASFELADGCVYRFTPEPGERERRFKLVAGDESFIRETLGSIFSVPAATLLERNRPNPFNQSTAISYQLAAAGRVTIALYNVAGQKIRTLADRDQAPGRYTLRWDGKDDGGRAVAAGIYVCRLAAPGAAHVRKLTVVR